MMKNMLLLLMAIVPAACGNYWSPGEYGGYNPGGFCTETQASVLKWWDNVCQNGVGIINGCPDPCREWFSGDHYLTDSHLCPYGLNAGCGSCTDPNSNSTYPTCDGAGQCRYCQGYFSVWPG